MIWWHNPNGPGHDCSILLKATRFVCRWMDMNVFQQNFYQNRWPARFVLQTVVGPPPDNTIKSHEIFVCGDPWVANSSKLPCRLFHWEIECLGVESLVVSTLNISNNSIRNEILLSSLAKMNENNQPSSKILKSCEWWSSELLWNSPWKKKRHTHKTWKLSS